MWSLSGVQTCPTLVQSRTLLPSVTGHESRALVCLLGCLRASERVDGSVMADGGVFVPLLLWRAATCIIRQWAGSALRRGRTKRISSSPPCPPSPPDTRDTSNTSEGSAGQSAHRID